MRLFEAERNLNKPMGSPDAWHVLFKGVKDENHVYSSCKKCMLAIKDLRTEYNQNNPPSKNTKDIGTYINGYKLINPRLIALFLNILPVNEQVVIKYIYMEGRNLIWIAKKNKVSRQTIHNILKSALVRIGIHVLNKYEHELFDEVKISSNNSSKKISINDLPFSIRVKNALYSIDINTLDQLLLVKKNKITSIANIGRKSIYEIDSVLKEMGYFLK